MKPEPLKDKVLQLRRRNLKADEESIKKANKLVRKAKRINKHIQDIL